MRTKLAPRTSAELEAIERCDAWYEYLAQTQERKGLEYEELEPWAWARLRARLRRLEQKRQAA